MFRDKRSLWKSKRVSPPSLRSYPQKSLWPMDLSPKTIRPEPIYTFRQLPPTKLQKGGYPSNWRQWSKWAKKRAHNRCQLCGRGGKQVKLDTHHITPIKQGGSTNPQNLICLCKKCHRKRHPRKWTKYIRNHQWEYIAKFFRQPKFR